MATEEPRDWIDRAIARHGMWEPPAGYVERLAARGMAIHEAPPRHRAALRELVESIRLRIEASLWVARQYRELLSGHS